MSLFKLIFYLECGYEHFKRLECRAINFSSSDIGTANLKAEFKCVYWCRRCTTTSRKNEKTKQIWLATLALAVSKWSSHLENCSRDAEFTWLYSWLLTNNSKTNLVALYRSVSVYMPSRPRTRVGIWAWAGASVGAGVWLPLVGVPSMNLSLLVERKLWQVRGLAIWFTRWVDFKGEMFRFLFF